jgi:hypothetical protein
LDTGEQSKSRQSWNLGVPAFKSSADRRQLGPS